MSRGLEEKECAAAEMPLSMVRRYLNPTPGGNYLIPRRLFVFLLLSILFVFCDREGWKPATAPLQTRWAADVTPSDVWREYPRPMMVRERWQNLNGLWEYAVRRRQASPPDTYDGKILVPFPVESALSGVGREVGEDSLLWYRTHFSVPSQWHKQRLLLHFEAVDWETRIWVNGQEVGTHRGGYDPFTFEISPYLNNSKQQELVVSVWDPTDKGFQARGKQVSKPGGIFYTASTGIWQTVWLEPVPLSFIKGFQVYPDIDQERIGLRVQVENLQENDLIAATACTREGTVVATDTANPGKMLTLPIHTPELWSPSNPYLYNLSIQLFQNSQGIDEVKSYFGMRKISLEKDGNGLTRLFLNNQFVFEIGPLDQGFFPEGVYTPPSDEAMKFDLQMIKEMGFNMLRKHVKIEPRRFYSWCDKIGLLVWQDMPSRTRPQDQSRERKTSDAQFEHELQRMIQTRFNHPSIIVWVPFNEGWGQYDTPRLVDWIHKLDPTRLVDDASGWTDRGVGDVIDIHRYPGPASPRPEPYRAAVLGEFGGLGYNMPGHMWQNNGWGYALFQTREELTVKYEDLLRRIFQFIQNPGLSAAVYTQITDIESENNGLMTYDREITKIEPQVVRLANQGFLPPQLLSEARIFIDKFEVRLSGVSRNTKIYYTLDGSLPTLHSLPYAKPFRITETTTVKARCFWPDGHASRAVEFLLRKVPPHKARVLESPKSGLLVSYYQGAWDQIPDFSGLTPEQIQTVPKIDLDIFPSKVDYALQYEGFVDIPETGVYVFYLTSDDGSALFIDEEKVIENDGIHGARERMGAIALTTGFHSLRLLFFQHKGRQSLILEFKRPGLEKQLIPERKFFHLEER